MAEQVTVRESAEQATTRKWGIVVLGRGIEFYELSGEWRPSLYFERKNVLTDPHSGRRGARIDPNDENAFVAGSNVIVRGLQHWLTDIQVQAKELEEIDEQVSFPSMLIYTTGQPRYLYGEEPEIAEGRVMHKRLIDSPAIRDILTNHHISVEFADRSSISTSRDIENGLRAGIAAGLDEIVFFSLGVHLDRMRAFAEQIREDHPELAGITINFQAAENCFPPDIRDRLRELEQTNGYQRTVKSEEDGVRQILDRTYVAHLDRIELYPQQEFVA